MLKSIFPFTDRIKFKHKFSYDFVNTRATLIFLNGMWFSSYMQNLLVLRYGIHIYSDIYDRS